MTSLIWCHQSGLSLYFITSSYKSPVTIASWDILILSICCNIELSCLGWRELENWGTRNSSENYRVDVDLYIMDLGVYKEHVRNRNFCPSKPEEVNFKVDGVTRPLIDHHRHHVACPVDGDWWPVRQSDKTIFPQLSADTGISAPFPVVFPHPPRPDSWSSTVTDIPWYQGWEKIGVEGPCLLKRGGEQNFRRLKRKLCKPIPIAPWNAPSVIC